MPLNSIVFKITAIFKCMAIFSSIFFPGSALFAYEISPASSTINYGNTNLSTPVSLSNTFNTLNSELLNTPSVSILNFSTTGPVQPLVTPVIILFDKNSIKDKLLKGEIKVVNGQIMTDTVLEQSNFSSSVNPGNMIHSTQLSLNSDGSFSLMPATAKKDAN